MSDAAPHTLAHSVQLPQELQTHSEDAIRIEVLHRFRPNCLGTGDQALRAAVLTYLTRPQR